MGLSEDIATPEVPMDTLTRVFLKIKARREELKKAFDAEYDTLGKQMDAIKSSMLDYMKEHGFDSVKTSQGLVYRTVNKRYWTDDWDAMGRFIIEHEVPQFFEKRLNQSVVRQFLEENPDVVPPGLNASAEYVVTVRKP